MTLRPGVHLNEMLSSQRHWVNLLLSGPPTPKLTWIEFGPYFGQPEGLNLIANAGVWHVQRGVGEGRKDVIEFLADRSMRD